MMADVGPVHTLIEIDGGRTPWVVTFSTNGECLICGGSEEVGVWQVEEEGERLATMEAKGVRCLAISKDDNWLAAGTASGWLIVWDTWTFKKVFMHKVDDQLRGVDFSSIEPRVVTASDSATIWDVAARTRVHVLNEGFNVTAAKYSPEGDRVVTATQKSIQVYDSDDGHLLINIPVGVTPWYKTGLIWPNNYLFVVADGNIKQIEASTGSTVSEWPIPGDGNNYSCMVVPKHGEFIAYSANATITLWDAATRTRLAFIQHPRNICSMALSPDNQFLAFSAEDGKITVKSIRNAIFPPSYSILPLVDIDDALLDSWKQDKLINVEALLTERIKKFGCQIHHTLTSRALVRARLRQWDEAIEDAEQSIKALPSVIGYIAKSLALIGRGTTEEFHTTYGFALRYCHPSCADLLLLIKAVILFMSGEHEAISRVTELVAKRYKNTVCYVVQAYMYLVLGNSCIENENYEGAIQFFQSARVGLQYRNCRSLLVISLISGWHFDDLGITIRQKLCDALHVAGHTQERDESLFRLLNDIDKEGYTSEHTTLWVANFTYRCLSAPNSNRDVTPKAATHDEPTIFESPVPPPLLIEWAKATLTRISWEDALAASVSFTVARSTAYRVICEHLKWIDRVMDATECFHQMTNELEDERNTEWAQDFMQHCAEALVRFGDAAVDSQKFDVAIAKYSAALSLNPDVPQEILMKRSNVYVENGLWEDAVKDANQVIAYDPSSPWRSEVLKKWAKAKLMGGMWKDTLAASSGLKVPKFAIYWAICERLGILNRLVDATECLYEMTSQLDQDSEREDGQTQWNLDLTHRCYKKSEDLGDAAMNTQRYNEAISCYSKALSFNPNAQDLSLLIKRSKVYIALGMWEEALDDANEVIRLDPSSPLGYERKRIALRSAGLHIEAIDAFETMLSKMSVSSDRETRERARCYVSPTQVKSTIRATIENAIRETPLMLINTDTGRLLDKSSQASSFEAQPIFGELISSMAIDIDQARINHEVAQYFRYVMFSHKWEVHEPPFEKVVHVDVYDLEESPTHNKLKTFCKISRAAGFHWAWSDTCCINKANHFMLQESLVAMFKWYEHAAFTIVFLLGVPAMSQHGALAGSIWNTRAWTFQEYHASRVVRFYTEDWTPYLNLDIFNHKESPEIISEMEEATGVSAKTLKALRPGLGDAREKLRLASTRHTTRVEDAAYSLLGIFSTSLPVVYGEGDKALGRFLAQLITSSGDTSILAWTGRPGSFNSCLPANIIAFEERQTTHVPDAIPRFVTVNITSKLLGTSLNFALAMELYDRVKALPVPSFAGQRMKLPCVIFKLGRVSTSRSKSGNVFYAQTAGLGIVEIQTEQNLSQLDPYLYLVHPWMDFLLDREPLGSAVIPPEEDILSCSVSKPTPGAHVERALGIQTTSLDRLLGRPPPLPPRRQQSLELPRLSVSPMTKKIQAIELIVRLTQPFGALLLTKDFGNVAAYRRVAADSLINVQLGEITDTMLSDLIDNVRVLDVL